MGKRLWRKEKVKAKEKEERKLSDNYSREMMGRWRMGPVPSNNTAFLALFRMMAQANAAAGVIFKLYPCAANLF